MTAMQPVAKRILSCFATALGYPANFFDEARFSLILTLLQTDGFGTCAALLRAR